MYLMPVMCLLYCFQFIDKMANSFASIMGMRKDFAYGKQPILME